MNYFKLYINNSVKRQGFNDSVAVPYMYLQRTEMGVHVVCITC